MYSSEKKQLSKKLRCTLCHSRYSAGEVVEHPWVAEDLATEDRDLSIAVAGKLQENFVRRKKQGGMELIAATALDHQSRYFKGRKEDPELPLQEFSPTNGHHEVF